jgi:hypothetical protein
MSASTNSTSVLHEAPRETGTSLAQLRVTALSNAPLQGDCWTCCEDFPDESTSPVQDILSEPIEVNRMWWILALSFAMSLATDVAD